MRVRNLFLTVGALSVLAMPAAAFAKAGDAQSFSASGYLCLTHLPDDMKAKVDSDGQVKLKARGEVLSGEITSSSGWDAVQGAAVVVTITKEESVFDLSNGQFAGEVKGDIAIASSEGLLIGNVSGSINGAFADPNDIVGTIYTSTPVVEWNVRGDKVKAEGAASATFTVDPGNPYAYCGTLSLSGSVRDR